LNFAKAAGLASRAWNQPNRKDARFNLGSMNKMVTSIAIAELMEKGEVALDDPIAKHLHDHPNADAARKATWRRAGTRAIANAPRGRSSCNERRRRDRGPPRLCRRGIRRR
jgi:hypothetical protein